MTSKDLSEFEMRKGVSDMDSSEQEDPEKPQKLHVKKMREQIKQLEDRKKKFKHKLDGLT